MTCLGCEQAQMRLQNLPETCHLCKCVRVYKTSAIGWTETTCLQHQRQLTKPERPTDAPGAGNSSTLVRPER